MELSHPNSKLILSTLLFFSQLVHLSLSTVRVNWYFTTLHSYDKQVLLRIQTQSAGKSAEFWKSHSTECCLSELSVCTYPIWCNSDGHVIGLSLNSSDPENQLSGSLPAAIAELASLESLGLYGPGFTGPIPPYIGKLTNLHYLGIMGTNMTGRIPGSLGRLKNLEYLQINANRFTNHVPKSLSQLTNLVEIDLGSNHLSGSIPDDFFLNISSRLKTINFGSNRLSGQIPKSIGLHKLLNLDLSHNQLTGPIPDCFKNGIGEIRLSNNRLTGSIPQSLRQVGFETLDLSTDSITDASSLFKRWNTSYFSLKINLSNNVLKFDFSKVDFPEQLGVLDISHNMIYGSIPNQMGQLTNLWSLDMSYNRLCGQIPDSPVLKQFSPANFGHNKCLCGAPLPPCK